MFKKILIGTDGSQGGDRALALARQLADDAHGSLVIVHVIRRIGGKGGLYPELADENNVQVAIEAQAEEARQSGITVETVFKPTDLDGPGDVIADVADSVDADVIVVGNRGHSTLTEMLVGGVALRLLHIAKRPVLVVPPARTSAPA